MLLAIVVMQSSDCTITGYCYDLITDAISVAEKVYHQLVEKAELSETFLTLEILHLLEMARKLSPLLEMARKSALRNHMDALSSLIYHCFLCLPLRV